MAPTRSDRSSNRVYRLPADVEAALALHCRVTRERPEDVVADAVALFLDEVDTPAAADDVPLPSSEPDQAELPFVATRS